MVKTLTPAQQKAEEILSQCNYELKDALYRSVWSERVQDDIRAYEKEVIYMDLEKSLTDEQVKCASELFVYDCKYDCNQSYWDNIKNVIELALDHV